MHPRPSTERSSFFCRLAALSGSLLESGQVLAEAHGDAAAHHGPSLTLLLINFGIYVVLAWVLLRKPLASLWVSRSETIRASVERSESLLREAQQAHAEAVKTEAALAARLESIRSERITSAQEEARELVDAARERAVRLQGQASQLGEAERSRRLDVIRREFSQRVIERAEQIVEQRMSDDSDRRMRATALSNDRGLALLSD